MNLNHCETCEFWVSDNDLYGECRRRSPQTIDSKPLWPLTLVNDGCGEYLREGLYDE